MTSMKWTSAVVAAVVATSLLATGSASAQTTGRGPWSFEVGVGWDNGIAGHINSSGIGNLNGQAVVVTPNTYEEVYGTGLHLRAGGGYMINAATEVTGIFIWQTLDADQVTPMGDIGNSNLYGQYSDYQMFGMDFGLRRYVNLSSTFRAYGEGLLGLGFLDKTDVTLVAPGADLIRDANDFYDQTTAWNAGANFGLVFQTGGRVDFFGQLGLRYVSGMAEVDDLEGTGLETINDKSSRWTLPFVGGVRVHF